MHIGSPLDASRLGIGMVHQHFRLIPDFTIAENVVLGVEPVRRGLFLDREGAQASVRAVSQEYGFSIDPSLRVRELTVGQMQVVEIIKILYRARPAAHPGRAHLGAHRAADPELFLTLRHLRDIGKTVIIITHKLGEVKEISERVTVMRAGRVVAVRDTAEVDERELSRLMVGKAASLQVRREPAARGRAVLELRQAGLLARGQDRPLLDRVDLDRPRRRAGGRGRGQRQRPGGAGGRGQRPAPHLQRAHPARRAGDHPPGCPPAAPAGPGLRAGRPPAPRLQPDLLGHGEHDHRQPPPLPAGRGPAPPEAEGFRRQLSSSFAIEGDPRVPIGTLSGGNIQKVILARELASRTDFILFSEPTWGLDVASSEFIYERIMEIRGQGLAILLLSSNLDEILSLADTLVVMYRGRVVARLANSGAVSKELVGEYMLGLKEDRP